MSRWVNFDDVRGQLVQAQLIIDQDLRFDARIQRWAIDGEGREKRGWSRLKEWTSKAGNTYIVGHFGVWRGNDDGRTRIALPARDENKAELTSEEAAAIRAAQTEAARQLKAERKREAETASRWAAAVWANSAPCLEHEYLARKQIQPHGMRVLPDLGAIDLPGIDESNFFRLKSAVGALVVPMHNVAGEVCGVQFVYPAGHPRKQKIERDKEFWPRGMAMGGSFGVLGHLRRGGMLLVAEGFATAASLHEATGQSVMYAFSANNLLKAAREVRRKYKSVRLLFCADDDYLTPGNPGVKAASEATAALEQAAWIKPDFALPDGTDRRAGKKLTDFNDLHALTGLLLLLANQVNARLDELKWRDAAPARAAPNAEGGGEAPMPSRLSIDEAAARFWGTYGMGGKVVFDMVDRRLVHKDDVLNLLPQRGWDDLKKHPGWRVARDIEIGFDPTERDAEIRCNLFGGWPTVPHRGRCEHLLELLLYMCGNEADGRGVYEWILKWLAYPLQHRGAKMHSAIVVHGPQGTGKSRFFEAYCQIFGPYGQVLGQEAIEDKFNADWAEKKLFILADEVLARQDLYHIKNRLKGFITGSHIRVNPKNVAAHVERNHMNIVFLSNEHLPIILENDDRRHCVIRTPPKPDEGFFHEVNEEIAAGGVAALHDHLLKLDLGEFRPWTKPPMTASKQNLIDLSSGSEQRFVREWQTLALEGKDGEQIPFCPCLGSHLYRVYEHWCKRQGEFRPRPANHFLNHIGNLPGWTASRPEHTWTTLQDQSHKLRKMVVPADTAMIDAIKAASPGARQASLAREKFATKGEWLTACFFAFAGALEFLT